MKRLLLLLLLIGCVAETQTVTVAPEVPEPREIEIEITKEEPAEDESGEVGPAPEEPVKEDPKTEEIGEEVETEPVVEVTLESEIIRLTNLERAERGLNELDVDELLNEVTKLHSKDMAKNNYFSHVNQEGEDPTDRAEDIGFPIRKEIAPGKFTIGVAENIGKMPIGNVVDRGFIEDTPQAVAAAQMDGWMNSPGHKKNILGDHEVIGVGCSFDGTHYLCTQNFQ